MFDRLVSRAAGPFGHLARHPWLLFAVCLAGNAVLLPYQGIYHDAELYAVQVLDAGTGRYADDLFLRHGGQSQYTLLPAALGGLAARFGVEPVFFIAYLLTNALRLAATQWLVFRLLGRTPAAAAGLLLDAVTRVPLGFGAVFLVNEPFFTARVPALAVSIAGLEWARAGRPWSAAGLFAVALIVHPLIAAPAVAVAVAWAAWGWATSPWRRAAVGAAAALAVAAAGAYLATTAGGLDPEWRELVAAKNGFVDPLHWPPADWLRLAVAGGCAVAVAGWAADRSDRRFLWMVVAVAAAGLMVAAVAARGSWLLLFQGQAFRAVWPLELLRLPLGLTVVARLWSGGHEQRLGAVALLVALLAGADLTDPTAAVALAGAVAAAVLATRVVARGPGATELWRPLAIGAAVWAVAWYSGVLPARLVDVAADGTLGRLAWAERVQIVGSSIGPAVRGAVALAATVVLLRLLPGPRAAAAVAMSVGLAAAAAAFAVPRAESTAGWFDPHHEDARFVRRVLADTPGGAGPPTVYWPCGTARTVWLDLRANSYFHLAQLAGNTYSRGAAVEGARRAAVVMPFEIDRFRRDYGRHTHLTGEDLSVVADLPPPTAEQFRTLAADPALDFAVLPYDYGGAVATNGRVYVYDCRALRAADRREP